MSQSTRSITIIAAAMLALAPQGNAAKAPAKSDYNITLAVDGLSENESAGWLAYAAGRITALTEREKARNKSLNDSGDDFVIELAGRQALVSVASELSQEPDKPLNPYFKTLSNISGAGFLDEYVVTTFSRPGWTIPSSALKAFDFKAFKDWLEKNPVGADHPTNAFTDPSNGKRWPDSPGEDLLDPATLKLDHVSCPATQKALGPSLKVWKKTAASLQGRAISADNRGEFVLAMMNADKFGTINDGGLTWVSYRPAQLAYASGFCGVETGDLSLAAESLRLASELKPLWILPKLELAQVLILQKKLTDADEIVESVIQTATDRCDMAMSYRKRGYIRIDQGRLEESRTAYRKSLEYDPENPIALSELKLIGNEIKKRSKSADDEKYEPPPQGRLQIAKCR